MSLTKSVFSIAGMDCSAEEQLVRMKLADENHIRLLQFDLPNRILIVYHDGAVDDIRAKIHELNLGDQLIESSQGSAPSEAGTANEARLLWYVLAINAACFLIEIVAGLIARSMGLIADSLDMLADAFVYALSLYAVGKLASRKKQVARISGYLQCALAVIGFIEVVRRFIGVEAVPDFRAMMGISLIALFGNAASLFILQRAKSSEAHIKASMIFTSNDIIINIGVIVAALLVLVTHSSKPDLIIGSIVFVIVMRGAIRILKLAR